MTTSGAMISLQGIRVTLPSIAGDVEILKGLNLEITSGEAVGITGPSGSGKSTLMAVMTGLEKVTGGEIRVAGGDLTRMSEDELARHRRDHIGVVLQAFHLIPTMTALENVAIPLELAGVKNARARATVELAAVGLSHRMDHYPAQLSGGEQQRVALARALVSEPGILFADEPTGNLDSSTGHSIMELIFDLQASRGTTLVLITHDATLAARCSRVIRMHDGQIAGDERGQARLHGVAAS